MIAFTTTLALTLSAPQLAPEVIGRHFVEQLAAKHFATAGDKFTDSMKSSLPPAKLAVLWDAVLNQKGAFKKVERFSADKENEGTAALITCRFAKAPMTFEVYLDDQDRIAGFFLNPASIIARRFLNLLAKSDFAAADAMLEPKLRADLPASKLGDLWIDLVAEGGDFVALDNIKIEPAGDDWAAVANARFAKKVVSLRTQIDGEARIDGFVRQ